MPAQYAHLDGRHYVNADFVNDVRKLYPVTTSKMPLGFACYVGWTGKDLVQFVQQVPEPDVSFQGGVFEAVPDPARVEAFSVDILPKVKYKELKQTKKQATIHAARKLLSSWGSTLKAKDRTRRKQASQEDWIRWG